MEHWKRPDGRYFYADVQSDLFGLVVVIAHGGRTPPRVHSIPVNRIEEADRVIERIGRRRAAHGYRREG